ncbi:MAG: heme o synthase [Terriglobales bacterium]
MASTHAMTDSAAASTIPSKLRDYYALTKPEVNLLILMTTSAGYYLGSSGPLRMVRLFVTLAGTLLVASGTATLNQWMERSYDAQMRRTANRPLVSGRLKGREACWFGLALSAAGGALLAASVNLLSALLAIGTLLGYLLVYTPLKRKTPLCTLLGAVPGAMPTLIGWAAASGGIGRNAWVLFGVLFLWQFPHFLAIALLYREDYAVAGFRMLPGFDADGRFTKAEIVVFAVVLVVVTMLPLGGGSGAIYSLIMFMAGAFFLYHTTKLAGSSSRVMASRVVHASVIYLPVVLGTMMAWKP